jgi:hypothetical protein
MKITVKFYLARILGTVLFDKIHLKWWIRIRIQWNPDPQHWYLLTFYKCYNRIRNWIQNFCLGSATLGVLEMGFFLPFNPALPGNVWFPATCSAMARIISMRYSAFPLQDPRAYQTWFLTLLIQHPSAMQLITKITVRSIA